MGQTLKQSHYSVLLTLIILLAAVLRCWELGALQQLVFDEVYFPKYGHHYLTGTYFFDSHPPLSKYFMAISIWLYNHLPWINDVAYNTTELTDLSAISWRWLNALTGTLLCFVAAKLSLLLYPSRILALLIALFIAIDGMFVVESRFGLNNIYLVALGICALFFLIKSFVSGARNCWWLLCCGVLLGMTYSVKWSGLGSSLVAWLLVFVPVFLLLMKQHQLLPEFFSTPLYQLPLFAKIPLWQYIVCLFIIPLLVYSVLWQPHLALFDKHGFIEMQKQILGYHSNSVSATDHPYCSPWYSWPLMIRPISYLFVANNTAPDVSTHNFVAIHLLGNPILFWLSTVSVLALFVLWLNNVLAWFRRGELNDGFAFQSVVIVGFAANWLPWSIVERCLFLYHYMPAAFFSFMALAWFIAKNLEATAWKLKLLGGGMLLAVVVGFLYWLPLSLGLSLQPDDFYERMWLRSWI